MNNRICLFAGTTEGRNIAEALSQTGLVITACVATDYGEVLLDKIESLTIHNGRMDRDEMRGFFEKEGFSIIIDATHPYAEAVTENIKAAAESCGVEYLRVLRDDEDVFCRSAVYTDSTEEAAAYLSDKEGNVLLTTGVKELPYFSGLGWDRVWARVLPMITSLEACEKLGITTSHIIAMQGPFSKNANAVLLTDMGAKYMVTKRSGRAGGYREKLEAAAECGVIPVIIGRPEQKPGMSAEEAVKYIKNKFEIKRGRAKVYVVGIGTGGRDNRTHAAEEYIKSAECLIGAGRMIESVGSSGKPTFSEISPKKIRRFIEESDYGSYAILVSGDVGYYSAARGLSSELSDCDVTYVPGIGTVSCFAARLGIPWDDVTLISLHGREQNLMHSVKTSRRVMALTGGENSVSEICRRLDYYGYGNVKVTVGERLSYPDERIICGTAAELRNCEFDPLSVMLIENENAVARIPVGIPDEEFIRGEVPMTKREVRAASVSALAPDADSVVYDIGAGSGSVSVELAEAAYRGTVYAVEKNHAAVELIGENARKFALENLAVVEGEATEVIPTLPSPTHVFIGGSSGNLREILTLINEKNPKAKLVINTVTLETLAETLSCAKEMGYDKTEFTELSVSRSRQVGRYNLMTAQNPVYVIKLERKEDESCRG